MQILTAYPLHKAIAIPNRKNMSIDTNLGNSTTILCEKLQWEASQKQLSQLKELQSLLIHFNKKINLTRLTNGDDYWIAQIIDSLWPFKKELKHCEKNFNFIDVGSGCGFPGIAIAIAMPETKITLLDSSKKKTEALKSIIESLGLDHRVKVRNERVEITGHNSSFRQQYDYALARALAPSAVVAEYLIPLIKKQGEAILYQGQWTDGDEKFLGNALIHLNAYIKEIQKSNLPKGRGIRHIIRLGLTTKCPNKYPRRVGKPSQKPLGS